MSTKPPIRWDWIEEQWQLNHLSNRAVAQAHKEQFGRAITEAAIRDRAIRFGWQRDISEAVRRQVRRKLAQGEIPEELRKASHGSPAAKIVDEETQTVEAASDAAVRVTLEHRDHAVRLHALATMLERYVVAQLPLDESGDPRLNIEPGELKDISGAANSVGSIRARAIAIERQSYGLGEDDRPASGSALEMLRSFLHG